MDGLSIGVIGCGYWGSKHVRVLQGVAGVERVVPIDAQPERLAEMARAYPSLASSCFHDLEAAIDHIDAAVVATPPNTHSAVALSLLQAGKGALVEKPLATSVAAADALIDAAAAYGATLMTGHTFEYNAAVWKLRELIEMGDLGELHYIDGARLNLGLYQSDVNVVWDLAPHDVSIFNHLLQATPTAVQAWAERHAHPELEDVAHLRLEYGSRDLSADIHVSWLDPCKVRRTTVVGDRRMVVYNDLSENERIRLFDKGVMHDRAAGPRVSYRYGDTVVPYIEFHEPLAYQDQHFVNCVINGSSPATDGESGRAVVAVLEAAQVSIREHRKVTIEEVHSRGDATVEMGVGS